MFQNIIIVGRLGQDPEVRMTANGQAVATVSVAVSEKWKKTDGTQQEKTNWFKVICWGKLAEISGKYLKKGSMALFTGKMEQRSWEADGKKNYTWELIASEMKMMDSKGSTEARHDGSPKSGDSYYAAPAYDAGYTPARGGSENDVPF
jgi:single-strand DNA-binding protein